MNKMSSGDITEKDEGISDVIALLKNVDVTKELASQSSESHQNGNDLENSHTNNDDPKSQCSNGEIKEDENVNTPTTTEPNVDSENATLDLSNPEQVMHMLENVDLTEEDTELLLQEAYNMNKKLKEILRRQQNTNEPKQSSKPVKRRVKQAGDNQSSTSVSSSTSTSNSRLGSATLKKAPLPPIEKEGTNVYAVKLQRARTNVTDVRQMPSHSIGPRSKSTTKEIAGQPRKSKVKSTEPKPDWNGRFNYT